MNFSDYSSVFIVSEYIYTSIICVCDCDFFVSTEYCCQRVGYQVLQGTRGCFFVDCYQEL